MKLGRARKPISVLAVAASIVAMSIHGVRASAAPVVMSDISSSPYYYAVQGQSPGAPEWDFNSYSGPFNASVAMGFHWLYAYIRWSDVASPTGAIDLSGADAMVVSAHDHGLQLVLQIEICEFSEPMPLVTKGYRTNTSHVDQPTCAPTDMSSPVALGRALVSRYRPGGSLAQQMGWTDGWGVNWYEIDNEPDSAVWSTGNWQDVPHDYALYLSQMVPAMRALYPGVKIVAPALSTTDTATAGLPWLERMLTTSADSKDWASDQYRSALAAGAPLVGGGPYIDAYSYHAFAISPDSPFVSVRPAQVRSTVGAFASQSTYPTTATPELWQTEAGQTAYGGASTASKYQSVYDVMQRTLVELAAGVTRTEIDFGSHSTDSDLSSGPIGQGMRMLTTYFPSSRGVVDESSGYSFMFGRHVHAITWTDPSSGVRDTAFWAPDQTQGSGTSGQPFTVNVPVVGNTATVIATDFTPAQQTSNGGGVSVTLQSADPSGVAIVVGSAPLQSIVSAPNPAYLQFSAYAANAYTSPDLTDLGSTFAGSSFLGGLGACGVSLPTSGSDGQQVYGCGGPSLLGPAAAGGAQDSVSGGPAPPPDQGYSAAQSSGAQVALLPGSVPANLCASGVGCDLLDASTASGQARATCAGASAAASIGSVTLAGTTVGLPAQPGQTVTVTSPAGVLATVTPGWNDPDPANGSAVAAAAVVSFPANGPLAGIVSGTVFVGYVHVSVSGCDRTPPVASAAISPAPNDAGWNSSPVRLAISATDGANGSGIRSVGYSMAGAETAGPNTVDGAPTAVQIQVQGLTTVTFWATDWAGNTSRNAIVQVAIDDTPPSVTWSGSRGQYAVDQMISIACDARDDLSGIAVDSCTGLKGPAYAFPVGMDEYTASATDRAGNTTTASVEFKVAVTADGLCNLTRSFAPQGSGVAAAACDDLAAARFQQYRAVISAQTGRDFNSDDASTLISLSEYLG